MNVFQATELPTLFEALRSRGYTIVGPTLRPGVGEAVVLEPITGPEQLPRGISDEQEPGRYRLRLPEPRTDAAEGEQDRETSFEDPTIFFGFGPGPQSWKRFLFAPRQRLLRVSRDDDGGVAWRAETPSEERFAFLGVRPCDLAAIGIQDRVFLGGDHPDPHYRARRENVFLVVAQCTASGGTCFCASMGTGPRAESGFDLAVNELVDGEGPEAGHRFLVEAGSPRGEELLADVPHRDATPEEEATARELSQKAARTQDRSLPGNVREELPAHLEHPRWDEVAQRCLSCGNCTLVCPTCFCSSVEDSTDLRRRTAERRRVWDSCFTIRHSYLHGGPVRSSTRSRYRQWLTHKLATWWDQFGTSGCVGCGRCITWCPVGIDITEEARAITSGQEVASP